MSKPKKAKPKATKKEYPWSGLNAHDARKKKNELGLCVVGNCELKQTHDKEGNGVRCAHHQQAEDKYNAKAS